MKSRAPQKTASKLLHLLLLAAYCAVSRAEQPQILSVDRFLAHEEKPNHDAAPKVKKFLELDLTVKPLERPKGHLMQLYQDDSADSNNESSENDSRESLGFFEKNLSDFFDIQIFSTVYFGSRQEPHQLIFDTGSSWLWVQSPYCENCSSETPFIHRHSDSFNVDSDFDIFQINYGSGSVLAFEGEDRVCLAENQACTDQTKFANVVLQHGLEGLQADGIVGLAPSSHVNAQGIKSELFVEKLFDSGAIDEPIFSLMINSDDAIDSKITIGGYDSSKFGAKNTELIWHDLYEKPEDKVAHWRLKLDKLSFGEHTLDQTVVDSVIVDSGTSLLLIPEQEYKQLLQVIEARTEIEYSIKNDFGLETFPCSKKITYASLPSIQITLDGYEYTIPPASYIGYNEGMCTLKIMTNTRDKNFITLGLNFFENYYTVFDVGQKRIGLQTAILTRNGLDLDNSFFHSSLSSMLLMTLDEIVESAVDLKKHHKELHMNNFEMKAQNPASQDSHRNQKDDGEDSWDDSEIDEIKDIFIWTFLVTLGSLSLITLLFVCQIREKLRQQENDKEKQAQIEKEEVYAIFHQGLVV